MVEPHELRLPFAALVNVEPNQPIRLPSRILRKIVRLSRHHGLADLMGLLLRGSLWAKAKAACYLILTEPREPAHEATRAALIPCLQHYARRLQQPLREAPDNGLQWRHFDAALRFVERLIPLDRINAMIQEIGLPEAFIRNL